MPWTVPDAFRKSNIDTNYYSEIFIENGLVNFLWIEDLFREWVNALDFEFQGKNVELVM